MSNLYRGLTGA